MTHKLTLATYGIFDVRETGFDNDRLGSKAFRLMENEVSYAVPQGSEVKIVPSTARIYGGLERYKELLNALYPANASEREFGTVPVNATLYEFPDITENSEVGRKILAKVDSLEKNYVRVRLPLVGDKNEIEGSAFVYLGLSVVGKDSRNTEMVKAQYDWIDKIRKHVGHVDFTQEEVQAKLPEILADYGLKYIDPQNPESIGQIIPMKEYGITPSVTRFPMFGLEESMKPFQVRSRI